MRIAVESIGLTGVDQGDLLDVNDEPSNASDGIRRTGKLITLSEFEAGQHGHDVDQTNWMII